MKDRSKKILSKTPNAYFIIEKFQILKKVHKRAKTLKNSQKKTHFFSCVFAFTQIEIISMIKIACLILNVLNLKSLLSNFFFLVASSLSIYCEYEINFRPVFVDVRIVYYAVKG